MSGRGKEQIDKVGLYHKLTTEGLRAMQPRHLRRSPERKAILKALKDFEREKEVEKNLQDIESTYFPDEPAIPLHIPEEPYARQIAALQRIRTKIIGRLSGDDYSVDQTAYYKGRDKAREVFNRRHLQI